MASRYLIARGELLTYRIPAPKRKPGKVRPYSTEENKDVLIPQIIKATETLDALPKEACPQDIAVAKMTLHPAYIAKSFFPGNLLRHAGLASIGSRTQRVKPRKVTSRKASETADTTQLFVAGTRQQLRRLASIAGELSEETVEGQQFAEIETFQAMVASDRIKSGDYKHTTAYEVGLHLLPDGSARELRASFVRYAKQCGFEVHYDHEFIAGGLMFVPVMGPRSEIKRLAQFSLIRVLRPMPSLRAAKPARGATIAVHYSLPAAEPLSSEPKVAILDGGLPDVHPLGRLVRRYFLADEDAADSPDYIEHGLGVTSAYLFGPIEPGEEASRPFAPVDHHRVLDTKSDAEDPLELYRTLGHIESVLSSRMYQFINLSLGPDLPIDDDDVHAWTAVIDRSLSDGEALLTVAVGNNGERDKALGLNRIQVPSDSVNAVAVGAVTRSNNDWKPASYSAVGPGRTPGKRKPDVVAFGGSPKEYFHHVASGKRKSLVANLGTSFAAPYVLRTAVGIRAILGTDVHPLTIKALLIHGATCPTDSNSDCVGWGCVPSDLDDLITCPDGVARILYQGSLMPGKFLRAPVPLPGHALEGFITLRATFCYASPVDPQDSSCYTKAGLAITFRPHEDKKAAEGQQPKTNSFFPSIEYRTEEEQRADLGKWETVLHAEHRFRGSSLKGSTFDIHYNAREGGGAAHGADEIPYALVLTVRAPHHPDLYKEILAAHSVLRAIEPRVQLPIRT